MLRGRRWYSAHREHLYQWLARTGISHAGVVGWYMGWNLLVVVPVLILADHNPTGPARDGAMVWVNGGSLVRMFVVYALAAALWIFGKRWCLGKLKSAAKAKLRQN